MISKGHWLYDDLQFIKKLQDGSLSPQYFNHQAHLRLAWILLNEYELDDAIHHICDNILHYVKHLGLEHKFHKTLSISAIYAVYHFMKQSEMTRFEEFLSAYPQLQSHFKDLIASHYSYDLLQSVEAKNEFVPPDLEPFKH